MVKNKRFTMKIGIVQFVDNQTDKTYCEYNLDEVVELLNMLHEENQSLKKEIENNIDSFKRSRSRRIQAEEENKQLKIMCDAVREELSLADRDNTALEKENEQLKHDATVLIQANQDYRRENEHLKKRIEHLERKIQRERTSAMKEHEKWEKEVIELIREQRKLIDELYKQNEQLKEEVDELENKNESLE